jgi:hypothetical protein
MRAHLMHRDRDFAPDAPLPAHAASLSQDLELDTVLQEMAQGDRFLYDVARKTILTSLRNDADTIQYRQAILKDCLANPAEVRQLYDLALATIEEKKGHYFGVFMRYPGSVLSGSIDLMEVFVAMLRKLVALTRQNASRFQSEGFKRFFEMLDTELSDDFFARVDAHLEELKFRDGVSLSVALGPGGEGVGYSLRRPGKGQNWLERLIGKAPPGYTFHVDERDEAGAKTVSDMRDRGINLVANALAQSADHILGFFELLRLELAFYIGCLNLHGVLTSLRAPTSFPTAEPLGSRRQRLDGLYDVCLALHTRKPVVANSATLDGKSLVIITGANQGGKSTFLRAIGVAQLMLQSGMFVGADALAAELCADLFTHYKREEDATMQRGKLEEELARMSAIADAIIPSSLMLLNESFASTNEREGSELARQIVRALAERGIKVFCVTHLYEFAHGFYAAKRPEASFLRADRQPDGTRTFKLVDAEPLQTSYGPDLYSEIFDSNES